MSSYPFFAIEKKPDKRIAFVYLNRPEKRNSMNWPFWRDLPHVVAELEGDPDIRAVVLAGKGKSFSMGLDLEEFQQQFHETIHGDSADGRQRLHQLILDMQSGFNAIAQSKKIYIAAVHKHCVGGALDLISACDIRLAGQDARFSLRETAVAIVADMGSLNRLPGIIGQGNTRMMAFTGGDFSAQKALDMGLVSEVYQDADTLMEQSEELAATIAANPRLAVQGTKEILNYMDGHSVADGLRYVAAWNAAFLDSQDFRELLAAFSQRRKPRFD